MASRPSTWSPHTGQYVEGGAWWHVQDDTARRWELTLQPRPKPMAGDRLRVVVSYGGETVRPADVECALYGWVTTRDGAMVVSEPEGSMTWYPVSDHQTGKATYSFAITVPEGKTAVANGLPHEPVTANGWTTWRWDAPDAQASYLTTASVGDLEQRRATHSSSGVAIHDFVDRKLTPTRRATTDASLALQPQMIDFFEDRLGPYRSAPTARSSTTTASATRSRRRHVRCTPCRPPRAPSPMRQPTSGSATR